MPTSWKEIEKQRELNEKAFAAVTERINRQNWRIKYTGKFITFKKFQTSKPSQSLQNISLINLKQETKKFIRTSDIIMYPSTTLTYTPAISSIYLRTKNQSSQIILNFE